MKSVLKREQIKENIQIYSLMLPVLILLFIFCYIPMYGIVIAFQNYIPGSPLKFVQTASYMPYFISTVIVAGMVISFFGAIVRRTIIKQHTFKIRECMR